VSRVELPRNFRGGFSVQKQAGQSTPVLLVAPVTETRAFVSDGDTISLIEEDRYVREDLGSHPGLQSLAYVPRIDALFAAGPRFISSQCVTDHPTLPPSPVLAEYPPGDDSFEARAPVALAVSPDGRYLYCGRGLGFVLP
jgi:hypothetical protein